GRCCGGSVSWPRRDDPDEAADEARLFREAVRGLRPLRSGAPPQHPPRISPRAPFTRADRTAVLGESLDGTSVDPALAGGDELVFRRPQVQPTVLRRLRGGAYRVEREIELHGLTAAEAKPDLSEFLYAAHERRVRGGGI